MNATILREGDHFVLRMGEELGSIHFSLEDAKRAALTVFEAINSVPWPPLGPKEWSPRGCRGAIPEGR